MKHGITRQVSGCAAWIPITNDEFECVRSAREGLLSGMLIEEKLDLVAENHVTYEESLLHRATRLMVFSDKNYARVQLERRLANQHLVNLLSACRLYFDNSAHQLSTAFGKESLPARAFSEARHAQYDAHLEYRTMEALRNYVQHREFPIHRISFKLYRSDGAPPERRCTLTPYVRLSELQQDGSIKPTLIDQLRETGSEYDATHFARIYVACIETIHGILRDSLRPSLVEWEAVMTAIMDRFRAGCPEESTLLGLVVEERDDNDSMVSYVPVFRDLIDYRRLLERKNAHIGRLASCHVTGKSMSPGGSNA